MTKLFTQAVKDTAVGSATGLSIRLAGFGGLIIGARTMSLEQFGLFSIVQAVVGIVTVLGDRGLKMAVVQTWTGTESLDGLDDALALRSRFFLGVSLATLLFGLASEIWLNVGYIAWVWTALLILTVRRVENVEAVLRVRERFGAASFLQGSVTLSFGMGAATAGVADLGVSGALLISLLAESAAAFGASYFVLPGTLRGTPRVGNFLRGRANHHLLISASVAVYSRSDRLFVGGLLGAEPTGVYSAAYNILLGFAIVGSIMSMTLLPAFKVGKNSASGRRLLAKLGLGTLVVAIVASSILFAGWHSLVELVTSGKATSDHIIVTKPLSLLAGLYLINGLLSGVLIGYDKEELLSSLAVGLGICSPIIFLVGGLLLGLGGIVWGSVILEALGLSVQLFGVRNVLAGTGVQWRR